MSTSTLAGESLALNLAQTMDFDSTDVDSTSSLPETHSTSSSTALNAHSAAAAAVAAAGHVHFQAGPSGAPSSGVFPSSAHSGALALLTAAGLSAPSGHHSNMGAPQLAPYATAFNFLDEDEDGYGGPGDYFSEDQTEEEEDELDEEGEGEEGDEDGDVDVDDDVDDDPPFPLENANMSYGQLVGNGLLAMDAYDSADMVDLDAFQLEDFERNLDFIRFVEQWYFRANVASSGYPRISDEAISVRNWPRPKQVTRAELDGDRYDIQGIDWTKIGVKRETARRVRRKLYRNYTNVQARSLSGPLTDQHVEVGNFFAFSRLNTCNSVHLSHFQLRNLLSCTSRTHLCYAGRSQIQLTEPATGATKLAMDLSKAKTDSLYPAGWKTSTLTATHDVLVVGGFGGEYAMVALDTADALRHVEGMVTTDDNGITNYVHNYLDRSSAHPRTVFCSNDRKVRVLDCYTNTFIKEHQYDWPVNCAATSADGRLRVIVGDDTSVTIAEADSGQVVQVLRGHKDYGFACAWADDGIYVATGNQDKQVFIYDARNWSDHVHVMRTEMAGARALRFSPVGGGKRVLAVAEPADIVHVLDASRFEVKQRLECFGEIAGMDISPDGRNLFLANSDELLGGILDFERIGWGEEYGKFRLDDPRRHPYRGTIAAPPDAQWDWADEARMDGDVRVDHTMSYRRRQPGLMSALI